MKRPFGLLVLSLLTFAAGAQAVVPSNLDCIAGSKGKKVSWNAIWGSDKGDHGVVYQVTHVSEINKIPTRQVTLEFKAVDSATQSHRRFVVDREEIARSVCERIVEEKPTLRFPGQLETNLDSLPFIHYTKDGWVRGTPSGHESLTICRLGHLRFSCPESDRQRFGPTLRTLEDDLKAQISVNGS